MCSAQTSGDALAGLTAADDLVQSILRAYAGLGASAHPGDLTLESAYIVQQQVFDARADLLAGYKLAATSPGARATMKLAEPLVGQIGARDIGHAMRVTAPSRPLYAEAELVFRLNSDLPLVTVPLSPAELIPYIEGVYAGIELCSSRFADDEVGPVGLVADNALLHAVVLGDRLASGWNEALAHCPVTLLHSAGNQVSGTPEVVMGHPLLALGWLAAWLGQRGHQLKAGHYIASGSITGITPVTSDAPISARFGELGQVFVNI